MKSKYGYKVTRNASTIHVNVFCTEESLEWDLVPVAGLWHNGTTFTSTSADTKYTGWKDALEFGKSIMSALLEVEGLK